MEDGIKTFPFPVKLDDRVKMVEVEFGTIGYAVVWKLHQAIYGHGYYLKWDIDTQLLFIDDYRLSKVGRNAVSEIVACCIRRGVFESTMFEKYQILTSERIQETFLTAKVRSKKVIMEKCYALPIVYTFIENASKNNRNVNIFWRNADIFKQKKGKEKKGNTPYNPPNDEGLKEDIDGTVAGYLDFMRNHKNITEDLNNPSLLYGIDFELLSKKISESKRYLQSKNSLKWIIGHYSEIISDTYKDFDRNYNLKSKEQKGDLQLWQELMKALQKAKSKRFSESLGEEVYIYLRRDQESDNEMKMIYRNLSQEIMKYFDPNSFLELCSMDENDLKYERARFLKALPNIRRDLEEN